MWISVAAPTCRLCCCVVLAHQHPSLLYWIAVSGNQLLSSARVGLGLGLGLGLQLLDLIRTLKCAPSGPDSDRPPNKLLSSALAIINHINFDFSVQMRAIKLFIIIVFVFVADLSLFSFSCELIELVLSSCCSHTEPFNPFWRKSFFFCLFFWKSIHMYTF